MELNKFEELGVRKDFVQGLNDLGIVTPTEIQKEVIPVLLNNRTDLIGQAQTGTGKTAAYGLPLLHQMNPKTQKVQGLVLCPTRELGQQIAKQLFKFTKYTDKIFTEAVYGGEYIQIQIDRLKRPTHIIVATPGRLIDLLKRKAVDLSAVKTIILDEADEMLSMGFKSELDEILTFIKSAQQKWLFSATIPHGIKQIVSEHMAEDAVRITVSGTNVVNTKIQHQYLICDEPDKLNILLKFLKSAGDKRGMVFCRTKAATQKLERQLTAKNIAVASIHGDLLQKEREKEMRAFKNGTKQLLIATDIAARGIDVPNLSYVLHFQLPDKDEYYTHRSGRTARAGKEGISLCLVSSQELKRITHYEKTLSIGFDQITEV